MCGRIDRAAMTTQAHHLNRTTRLLLVLLAALIVAGGFAVAPAIAGSGSYPWPVKPFDRQHPVRGNFGDPRTLFNTPPTTDGALTGGGSFQFHFGVDISAPDGTPGVPGRVGHRGLDLGQAGAGQRLSRRRPDVRVLAHHSRHPGRSARHGLRDRARPCGSRCQARASDRAPRRDACQPGAGRASDAVLRPCCPADPVDLDPEVRLDRRAAELRPRPGRSRRGCLRLDELRCAGHLGQHARRAGSHRLARRGHAWPGRRPEPDRRRFQRRCRPTPTSGASSSEALQNMSVFGRITRNAARPLPVRLAPRGFDTRRCRTASTTGRHGDRHPRKLKESLRFTVHNGAGWTARRCGSIVAADLPSTVVVAPCGVQDARMREFRVFGSTRGAR